MHDSIMMICPKCGMKMLIRELPLSPYKCFGCDELMRSENES